MNSISAQTHIRAHNINIKYFAFHVSAVRQEIYTCPGVGWCRVAGLAETITNSVKLKLKLRLSLAINETSELLTNVFKRRRSETLLGATLELEFLSCLSSTRKSAQNSTHNCLTFSSKNNDQYNSS